MKPINILKEFIMRWIKRGQNEKGRRKDKNHTSLEMAIAEIFKGRSKRLGYHNWRVYNHYFFSESLAIGICVKLNIENVKVMECLICVIFITTALIIEKATRKKHK